MRSTLKPKKNCRPLNAFNLQRAKPPARGLCLSDPSGGTHGRYQAKEERNDPKKPVGEQITDLVAVAAGALAETAVKSVGKRVRKAAAKKTPEPVKKAVKSISKVSKAPKRSAKKVVKRAKKSTAKQASKKKAGKKAKKSRSRR
jgi:hypothetical protein